MLVFLKSDCWLSTILSMCSSANSFRFNSVFNTSFSRYPRDPDTRFISWFSEYPWDPGTIPETRFIFWFSEESWDPGTIPETRFNSAMIAAFPSYGKTAGKLFSCLYSCSCFNSSSLFSLDIRWLPSLAWGELWVGPGPKYTQFTDGVWILNRTELLSYFIIPFFYCKKNYFILFYLLSFGIDTNIGLQTKDETVKTTWNSLNMTIPRCKFSFCLKCSLLIPHLMIWNRTNQAHSCG